jgi:hypothetical protein
VSQRKGNKIIIDGDTAYIYMKHGYVAIIDAEDVQRVNEFTWCLGSRCVQTHTPGPPQKTLKLSRLILFGDKHATDKRFADHEDHNILNNRKYNLRPSSNQQNQQNRLPQKNSTSKHKGVCWHKRDEKWMASIRNNGPPLFLGYFADEIMAARAYDEAAKKLHGEFACLNFSEQSSAIP